MYWRNEEDDDKAKFDCEADNDDPMSKKYGLQAQFITRIKFHCNCLGSLTLVFKTGFN